MGWAGIGTHWAASCSAAQVVRKASSQKIWSRSSAADHGVVIGDQPYLATADAVYTGTWDHKICTALVWFEQHGLLRWGESRCLGT